MDPDKATGKPHTLWVAFAKLYERHSDLPNARIIFEKAAQVGRPGWLEGGLGWGLLDAMLCFAALKAPPALH